MTVAGNTAYVTLDSNGIQVFDVSDPAHPSLLTSYDTDGGARSATFSGGYVYVADFTKGLKILHVDPPNSAFSSTSDTVSLDVSAPPTITSATYDASTGTLVVTGTDLVS
ncbi:MAG: hypothetical protein EKK49_21050, partial [Rhodocyclaceae bacterium]